MDYREFCAFKRALAERQEQQTKPGATWRVSFDWDYIHTPEGEEIVGAWWLLRGFFFWRSFFGVSTSLDEIAANKRDFLLVGQAAYRRFMREFRNEGLADRYLKVEFLGVRDAALVR